MRDRPNDQHRAVAEAKVGRKLTINEIVHHADEDKANNAPANLDVKERGPHTSDHNKNRGLSRLRSALRMVREGKKLY
jgi:hypothetical protein